MTGKPPPAERNLAMGYPDAHEKNMRKVLVFAVLLVLPVISSCATAPEFKALGFGTEKLEIENGSQECFGLRINVKNGKTPGRIMAVVKALDENGFEIKSIVLEKNFRTDEEGALLGRTCFDKAPEPKTIQWIVYEIDKAKD